MGRQVAIAVALLVAVGVLLAVMTWSTSAQGQEPGPQKTEDVLRVERAATELAAGKRAAAGDVAANGRTAVKALSKCRKSGPGWKAIRAVRVSAQRSVYARGARMLWKDLGEIAAERAAYDAYRPAFARFLHRFDTPLADPVLQAGVDAWRKRMDLYESYTPIGTCSQFDKLAKRARQFHPDVEADYKAGHIYSVMSGFVDDTKRAATRKHWGSRYEQALRTARDRLVELGGNEGWAAFFSFAYSLRG